jgi:hypothetical protein
MESNMKRTTESGAMEDACEEECSICCEEIKCDAAGVVFHCGHKFHGQCICDWMARGNASCPNCRQFHPDHHQAAPAWSSYSALRAPREEDEFSDSANSDEENVPSLCEILKECILQARKDKRKDNVVNGLYTSLMDSRKALREARNEEDRARKEFLRKRKMLKRRCDQMFVKEFKNLKKSDIGKKWKNGIRSYRDCDKNEKISMVNLIRHYHNDRVIHLPSIRQGIRYNY